MRRAWRTTLVSRFARTTDVHDLANLVCSQLRARLHRRRDRLQPRHLPPESRLPTRERAHHQRHNRRSLLHCVSEHCKLTALSIPLHSLTTPTALLRRFLLRALRTKLPPPPHPSPHTTSPNHPFTPNSSLQLRKQHSRRSLSDQPDCVWGHVSDWNWSRHCSHGRRRDGHFSCGAYLDGGSRHVLQGQLELVPGDYSG